MRLRTVWVGAVAVMMACGEAVGPPGVASGPGDLEFTAPMLRAGLDPSRSTQWNDSALADEPHRVPIDVRTVSDASALLPQIYSTFLTGEWRLNELWYEVGMYGVGNAYSMQVHARVMSAAGTVLLDADGPRREERSLFWMAFYPHMRDVFLVGTYCGAQAELKADFEARSELPVLGSKILKSQKNESTVVIQAPCPSSGGGGSMQFTDGYRVFLCQYEAWVDTKGNVIQVEFFGCTEVSREVLAE